jgi:hypothetical protein
VSADLNLTPMLLATLASGGVVLILAALEQPSGQQRQRAVDRGERCARLMAHRGDEDVLHLLERSARRTRCHGPPAREPACPEHQRTNARGQHPLDHPSSIDGPRAIVRATQPFLMNF